MMKGVPGKTNFYAPDDCQSACDLVAPPLPDSERRHIPGTSIPFTYTAPYPFHTNAIVLAQSPTKQVVYYIGVVGGALPAGAPVLYSLSG